jgi:hypothetical protein
MRPLRETIADARCEWRRAGADGKLRVAAVLPLALLRVLIMTMRLECAAALRSPFAWRWLAMAAVIAFALVTLPRMGSGGSILNLPRLTDYLTAFLLTTPVSLYAVAFTGARTERVPVRGMAVFVGLVIGTTLLFGLPAALAHQFASVSGGRLYLPTPWPLAVGYAVPCLVLCVCALVVAERVRQHHRRAFLASLALVLPIAMQVLYKEAGLNRFLSTAAGLAVAQLMAAIPLVVMAAILVRSKSTERARA